LTTGQQQQRIIIAAAQWNTCMRWLFQNARSDDWLPQDPAMVFYNDELATWFKLVHG